MLANTGSISATIPSGTATGTGYRIRVLSSTPAITASDNGTGLTINLRTNSIAPTGTQSMNVNTNGTALSVTESATVTSRVWAYSLNHNGPYTTIPSAIGVSYTPNFSSQGTYYVVCISTWDCGSVTSNEVIVNVLATLTTGNIIGSTFCAGSPIQVPFTSAGTFTSNTYSAELSGPTGSWSSPTVIGTLSSNLNSGTINATIPPLAASGSGYLVRVTSSNPAITSSTVRTISVNAIPVTTGVSICVGGSGQLKSTTSCGIVSTTSGPNNAGTGGQNTSVGNGSWGTTTGNITNTADINYATQILASNTTSNYLTGTNYGFSIPTGATITGIGVSISHHATGTTRISDNSVKRAQ